MNGLKNIAGNDVSIFLFRFDLSGNGIDFVLNEAIVEDMYADIDEKIKPLAHACCETLTRYRHLSISDTIMDCCVLDTGEVEIMLCRGLGQYFIPPEKENLFRDAGKISEFLNEVMSRKTKDLKECKRQSPQKADYPFDMEKVKKGIEELGLEKYLLSELERLTEGLPKPNLKPLSPTDLPEGVEAVRGYDHRGHCLEFKHKTLGNLGKIVSIGTPDKQTLIQADLNMVQGKLGDTDVEAKKEVFQKVVDVVTKCFKDNFPR